jgi:hypothetical protein
MRFRPPPEASRRTDVWQVKTYGYPEEDALARRMEDAAKATEAQWWDHYQMNQRR